MVPYSLIDNDIKGEKFKSFVSYCLKNSTQFSLTFHDYEENKRSEIYKKLSKCLKKTIQTYTWYQYKTIEKPLHIEIYHSNMVVLDTILKQFDSLFNNKKNGIEDLKNRKLFASRDYGLVFLHKTTSYVRASMLLYGTVMAFAHCHLFGYLHINKVYYKYVGE